MKKQNMDFASVQCLVNAFFFFLFSIVPPPIPNAKLCLYVQIAMHMKRANAQCTCVLVQLNGERSVYTHTLTHLSLHD